MKRFDAWLTEQPLVYAEKPDRGGELWDRNQATNDTHRARLVEIEPLEKKP